MAPGQVGVENEKIQAPGSKLEFSEVSSRGLRTTPAQVGGMRAAWFLRPTIPRDMGSGMESRGREMLPPSMQNKRETLGVKSERRPHSPGYPVPSVQGAPETALPDRPGRAPQRCPHPNPRTWE